MTTFANLFWSAPAELELLNDRADSARVLLPPGLAYRGRWSGNQDASETYWQATVCRSSAPYGEIVAGRKVEVDSNTPVVEFRELIRRERRKVVLRSWIACFAPKSTPGRRTLVAAFACLIWALIVVIGGTIHGTDATATSDRTVVDSGGARPNQTTGVPGTEPLPPTGTVAPAPGPWIVPPGASWTDDVRGT